MNSWLSEQHLILKWWKPDQKNDEVNIIFSYKFVLCIMSKAQRASAITFFGIISIPSSALILCRSRFSLTRHYLCLRDLLRRAESLL